MRTRSRCAMPVSRHVSVARRVPTARTPAGSSASTSSTRSRCSRSASPRMRAAEHQRLLAWEKQFLDQLELPYRVIDVATGDLGSSAARKFDIEAWIPTQGKYREVTSTSNCTEFQARRLGVRHARRRSHQPGGDAERHLRSDPAGHRRHPGEPPAGRWVGACPRTAAGDARNRGHPTKVTTSVDPWHPCAVKSRTEGH